MENRYDLKGITFLTFVRIDNEERKTNLKAMHDYYRKTCKNYIHIFIEDDSECKVSTVLDLHKDDVCIFSKSDTEWRKGEGFNKGIKLAKTNILNLIDVDVIVHPEQILETSKLLSKDKNSCLIYPYNGLFLCAEKELKDKFCSSLDYNDFKIPEKFKNYIGSRDSSLTTLFSYIDNVYEGVMVGHVSSKGGCVMGRRDNMIRCNGYNPNFLGWGYEDDEAPYRMSKLGYGVGRIEGEGKVIWHLHHFDGTGSEKEKQPFYKENQKIMTHVEDISSYELKDYIKSWVM